MNSFKLNRLQTHKKTIWGNKWYNGTDTMTTIIQPCSIIQLDHGRACVCIQIQSLSVTHLSFSHPAMCIRHLYLLSLIRLSMKREREEEIYWSQFIRQEVCRRANKWVNWFLLVESMLTNAVAINCIMAKLCDIAASEPGGTEDWEGSRISWKGSTPLDHCNCQHAIVSQTAPSASSIRSIVCRLIYPSCNHDKLLVYIMHAI